MSARRALRLTAGVTALAGLVPLLLHRSAQPSALGRWSWAWAACVAAAALVPCAWLRAASRPDGGGALPVALRVAGLPLLVAALGAWRSGSDAAALLAAAGLGLAAEALAAAPALSLLLGSTLLALAVAEFTLAWRPWLLPLPAQRPGPGDGSGAWQYDTPPIRTGFRFQPRLDRVVSYDPDDPALFGLEGERLYRAPAVRRRFQYRFRTDRNGFLASEGVEGVAARGIAMAGDSFLGWSAAVNWLEVASERIGAPIANLGIPHWGPQAEVAALEDFAWPARPRCAALAYFEGNDLREAALYERVRQSGLAWDAHVRSRLSFHERLRVGLLLDYAFRRGLHHLRLARARPAQPVSVRLGGRLREVALAPPYLAMLTPTAEELAASRNMALAFASLDRIPAACRAPECRFVFVFVPSEEHVTLPLLPEGAAQTVFEGVPRLGLDASGLLDEQGPSNLAAALRNLDAQRGAVVSRAARMGADVLDLTAPLAAAVASGEEVYNLVDTHWNDRGHALAGRLLGDHLRAAGCAAPAEPGAVSR